MEKTFNVTGTCFPDKHYMADVTQKMASTLKLVEKGADKNYMKKACYN
jgi:hypothetical protein